MTGPLAWHVPVRPSRARVLLASVLLFAAIGDGVGAQAAPGFVEGVARSDDDGSPIPFALIRLQRIESHSGAAAAPQQQGVTTALGRFRFASVPPGEYRLQLLRIGYRPVLSAPISVVGGQTLHHELRAPTQAVQLAAVTIHPEGTCLTASRLSDDPRLATLWNEARKGVEIRRAVELQYRYTRSVRQEGTVKWRVKSRRLRKADTLINEPDSVVAREARRRAEARTSGYSERGLLVVPNEKELVHEEFLRDHCLESSIAAADGELGLRFRPVRGRRDAVEIRGTIWVDATNYMMRRLDVEWLRGDDAVGRSRIDYADVAVGGSMLRLPSSGRATARPSGLTRALISGAVVTFTYEYRNFEQVRTP